MFNLGKMLRYAGRIVLFVTLIVFLTVILSVLTEASKFGETSLLDLFVEVLRVLAVIMLPLFVAVVGAFLVAGAFVKAVYKLNGFGEGIDFIMHQRFGRPGFKPFLILDQGKITMGADGPLPQRGGPGALIIRNNTAVVTEKRGKLFRVEGVGFPQLKPFEMIYDIIDLQPKRWVYSVGAMTKEGIPITWPVEIRYQIDDGDQESTRDAPYPFSAEAVFKASVGKWRREISRAQEMDWQGWLVVSQTEGTFRSMLARRHLDELIGLTEAENLGARETLQQELEEAISAVAPKVGVKILGIKLQNLIVDDKVTQQWIEAWQAGWQRWSTKNLAPFEAERIKEYETAKVDAQLLPLNKLTDELQKLDADAGRAILIARLASVIDRGHADVASRIYFPGQALGSIRDVSGLLRGDNGGDGDGPRQVNGDTLPRPLPPPVSIDMNDIEWRSRVILRLPIIDEIAAGAEKPVSDDISGYVEVSRKIRIVPDYYDLEAGMGGVILEEDNVFNDPGYVEQTGTMEFEYEGQSLIVEMLKGTKLEFSENFEYFAVQVSGDSMNQANITPGDYVILQKPNRTPLQPNNRDIVAIVFRDEDNKATLKRILIGRDGVALKPESSNPKHRPRTIPPKAFAGDNPQVQIVGIAIAVLKNQYELIRMFFEQAGFTIES